VSEGYSSWYSAADVETMSGSLAVIVVFFLLVYQVQELLNAWSRLVWNGEICRTHHFSFVMLC
jgi:hypothetical protein